MNSTSNSDIPLVSIIVITYNSSPYVLETLESAKLQTYQYIELIISDDFSADNTLQICRDWIDKNKERFVRTELVTSSKNTGIAGNCNRGLNIAKGEWLKYIAGDDILLDDCISDYMNYVPLTKNRFIFAFPSILINPKNDVLKLQKETYYRNFDSFFNLPAKKQFNFLLMLTVLPMNTATVFYHKKTLIELHGFDQQYLYEDLPIYLKATYNGYQLAILKKTTVHYRIHSNSFSMQATSRYLVNEFWVKEKFKIRNKYLTISLFLNHPLVFIIFFIQNTVMSIFMGKN